MVFLGVLSLIQLSILPGWLITLRWKARQSWPWGPWSCVLEHLTERAISAHFDCANPGGLVVMAYPTPTWLYRLSRKVAERMSWWIFHDENPLTPARVAQLAGSYGDVLEHRINWLNPFTQAVLVARKRV